MRVEIVLTKEEVEEVLRDSMGEAGMTVTRLDEGSLKVSVEPVTLAQADFAEVVCTAYDLPDDMEVESVSAFDGGGVGLVLRKTK
jgi:type II secretory pathway component PulM